MKSPEAPTNRSGFCRQKDDAITSKDCHVKHHVKQDRRQRTRRPRSIPPLGPCNCVVPTTNRFTVAPTEEDTLLLPGPEVSFIGCPTYGDFANRGKARCPSAILPAGLRILLRRLPLS